MPKPIIRQHPNSKTVACYVFLHGDRTLKQFVESHLYGYTISARTPLRVCVLFEGAQDGTGAFEQMHLFPNKRAADNYIKKEKHHATK